MKTKLFTLFLALVTSVGTMSAAIVKIGDLYYYLKTTNLTAEVRPWSDSGEYSGSIVIPSSVTYNAVTYSVTSIGNKAFYNSRITSVTIPEGITTIGKMAFENCYGLNTASLPNSVTELGENAFWGCSGLTSLTFGSGITKINEGAFNGCRISEIHYNGNLNDWCSIPWSKNCLTSGYDLYIQGAKLVDVIIPNGRTSIGDSCFCYCKSVKNITIPSSVTSIGNNAFYQCTGLTSITLPSSITSIGEVAFNGCCSLTSVNIPNSVTSIGRSAFVGCIGLTSITIPNSITSIGSAVFSGCSGLTSVTIPNSVTNIGSSAFETCTGLTSIEIPNSVTRIGEKAFYSCTSLTSVTIGSGVLYISSEAFYACDNLTEVTIEATTPPTLARGTNYVFHYSIQSIYVPCGSLEAYKSASIWSNEYQSKIKYKPSLFTITPAKTEGGYISVPKEITICDDSIPLIANPNRGCYFIRWADGNTENPRIIELTQDTTMEAIFDYLLTGKCGKDSVLTWTFEPSTMALEITGKGALSENYTYGTFIESLTIGNEVTTIGRSAFYGCNNLKNVIIGSSVKVLEEAAFSGCSAIETITCYSQRPPTVNNYALYGLDYSTIVYVPADYLETYMMHDAWGLYDVRPLGAKTTETTEVNVTPSETTAEVTWPSVTGAASYELVIKDKDGNVICTLVFNANGQLTSIAFNAPSRDHAPQQTQASGFSFTVTGLEGGTGYDLTITAKDSNGSTLDSRTVSFTTTGEQGIDEVSSSTRGATQKIVENGQILILRGDKTYTLTGQEVR